MEQNTTYTVIKKLESKGYIKREEPGFICTSLISREDVCRAETQSLIDKFFVVRKRRFFLLYFRMKNSLPRIWTNCEGWLKRG